MKRYHIPLWGQKVDIGFKLVSVVEDVLYEGHIMIGDVCVHSEQLYVHNFARNGPAPHHVQAGGEEIYNKMMNYTVNEFAKQLAETTIAHA